MPVPLPRQPERVPWPTEQWPTDDPHPGLDRAAIHDLVHRVVARQPAELGVTLAVLAVQGGRLVAEAYGPGVDADTPLISWSMAKSMLHAVVGTAFRDGLIDPDAPAAVPEWANDERRSITVRQLLRMRSGLAWVEDYVDDTVSDVIDMLFGSGAEDMGAHAASRPLVGPPGSVWNYSSGTSNIVSRLCRDTIAAAADHAEAAYRDYLQSELFGPLGMRSAEPSFDGAGTWVGSSYVHATARDFARFGLWYLRDGWWEDRRLLPPGWVDSARSPHAHDAERNEDYGEHWWVLADGLGSFAASGYEGQRIVVCPAADLVVVRLGKTPADLGDGWRDHLAAVVRAFAG
ncbi:MAG: serine hydrolase [Acidimicrobiales bacterium]|nr:serine hydrolase [Acidimicrobiales bacterium]